MSDSKQLSPKIEIKAEPSSLQAAAGHGSWYSDTGVFSGPSLIAWNSVSQEKSSSSVVSDVEIIGNFAKVSISDEILKQSKPLWTNYVVGHFIGNDAPHIGKVHATVNRIWSTPIKSSKIDAQFFNPKTVIFRIDDSIIRSRVLRKNFWHIGDIPMIVQQWCPKTTNLKPDLTSTPIWVDFKDVPDHLFSEIGLKFLGNIIGSFQKLHPNTQRCIHLDVARVLVVLNLEEPLPAIISLNTENETSIQVSYPWLPTRCSTCNLWGHKEAECAQMKMGSVVIQTQNKGSTQIEKDGVKSQETDVLKQIKKVSLDTELVAQVALEHNEKERLLNGIDEDSLEKSKTLDTEVQGNDWTLVTGKVSPRTSPGKKRGNLQQTSLEVVRSSEVSPSRFNLLANISEEEEQLEEGEISVAEDEKEDGKEEEDENSVASEAEIQDKLKKLKAATSQKKRAGNKKNNQSHKEHKNQKEQHLSQTNTAKKSSSRRN
ncbi:hypothetical protein Bca101_043811 [Brassica carinata]